MSDEMNAKVKINYLGWSMNAKLMDIKGKLPNLFTEDEEGENSEKMFKTD